MIARIASLLLFQAGFAHATNPEFTTVPQPANLVEDSVAGCIPLTAVACYHNYRFGTTGTISASRPFLGGAREWSKGSELNANLASVFGFQIKGDPPHGPAEIHIRDWKIPDYSPHHKAEVLAATIHCLILNTRPSADYPLDVQIVAENKNDLKWSNQFQKQYVVRPGKDNKPVTPTPVGNTFIKTDGFGTRYVISPRINPEHLTPHTPPVILPLAYPTTDGKLFPLVPHWPTTTQNGDTREPLKSLELPHGHFQNAFQSGRQFSQELNPLLQGQEELSLRVQPEGDRVELHLSIWKPALTNLSAFLASAAITSKANHDKSMKITIDGFPKDSDLIPALEKTAGWKKGTSRNGMTFTTVFDYDPKTGSLTKGTLPGNVVLSKRPDGQIELKWKNK